MKICFFHSLSLVLQHSFENFDLSCVEVLALCVFGLQNAFFPHNMLDRIKLYFCILSDVWIMRDSVIVIKELLISVVILSRVSSSLSESM